MGWRRIAEIGPDLLARPGGRDIHLNRCSRPRLSEKKQQKPPTEAILVGRLQAKENRFEDRNAEG
ncbi:hypothetical protein ACFMPD_16425, partial [Sedimentitalea sp. HM32M-2]|uniref:hypothetical protein n=1 Tax=Sedimentitalea sp. HM32M-2 TaxID=3351566 RepID=UPI003643FD76